MQLLPKEFMHIMKGNYVIMDITNRNARGEIDWRLLSSDVQNEYYYNIFNTGYSELEYYTGSLFRSGGSMSNCGVAP